MHFPITKNETQRRLLLLLLLLCVARTVQVTAAVAAAAENFFRMCVVVCVAASRRRGAVGQSEAGPGPTPKLRSIGLPACERGRRTVMHAVALTGPIEDAAVVRNQNCRNEF